MNVAYNMDCLAAMREMPDKAFDLCVADPPYGVNRFLNNQPTRLNKYGSMQTANDLKPTAEYFKELFRVSKKSNHLGL
jgi:DNA modification methylase